nr:MAG: putative RNA-dependent RNA polymerase [Mitoviridae sp.]
MSSETQTHVGCFVATTVLGKSGKPYQKEVERLLSNHGPEFVCERMKVIWNASVHLRNGDKDSAIGLYQKHGIAHHKKDGTPKGPFRPAVVRFVHAQRPSKVKSSAAVLRFYTTLKLSELSEKQSTKAKTAITTPSRSAYQVPEQLGTRSVRYGPKIIRQIYRHQAGDEYIPPMRDRYADGMRATSYYHSRVKLPKGMNSRNTPYSSMALSLMTEPWVPKPLQGITPLQEMRDLIYDQGWSKSTTGRITALQEQGCKARVVAMPTASIQLAFLPLHYRLREIIKHAFPNQDCMDDQSKGARGVLKFLRAGNDVYSVDLSSATDRFPVGFSAQVLRDLGMSNYAEALLDVSQSDWDSPWGTVSYAAGQPMGLYGSFPLFHLSNMLLANLAEGEERSSLRKKGTLDSLRTFDNGHTFYTLGDDIVFSDPGVTNRYRRHLDRLGVDISEHKSFSGKVAEFAGFMFVPTNYGTVGFRPYKPPVGEYVTNPVNLLDAIGPEVQHVSARWKQRFADYQNTSVFRSLDLTPLFTAEESRGNNPYRGDASTFVSLSNRLSMLLPEDSLPDLSGSTKINVIPLFNERGFGDYYGFNPVELSGEERRNPSHSSRKPAQKLYDDPLMKAAKANRPKVVSAPAPESGRTVEKPLPRATESLDSVLSRVRESAVEEESEEEEWSPDL